MAIYDIPYLAASNVFTAKQTVNATVASDSVSVVHQNSATGSGLTIIPGANTGAGLYALGITNALNTVTSIAMYGDGSATFGGTLGVSGSTITGTNAAGFDMHVVKTGTGAIDGSFYAGNNKLGVYDYTNSRDVWYYTPSTNALAISPATAFAGNVGVGGAPPTTTGLYLVPSALTGASQTAQYTSPTFTSAATTAGVGLQVEPSTAVAAYTMTSGYGVWVKNFVKGAGSTITTQYGVYVDALTSGTTNYALYTNAGLVRFGGAVTITAGGINVTGGVAVAGSSLTFSGGATVSGQMPFASDNSFDIGASGASRPRTGYFGTSVIAPTLTGTLSTAAQTNVTSLGTQAADLLFTDATYDIGKVGATRPRDVWTSRNMTAGQDMLAVRHFENGDAAGGSSAANALLCGSSGSLGFFNAASATRQTVTGSRGANAALASLLTALAAYGLVVNSSS